MTSALALVAQPTIRPFPDYCPVQPPVLHSSVRVYLNLFFVFLTGTIAHIWARLPIRVWQGGNI